MAGHAQWPCNKHRTTPINPQFPTAEAPAGYGRPTGSCHVRRPIPGSRYARQWATLVDVLRVALNVANLATGKPIITSINPQVPTAKAPAGYGRTTGSWHVRRPIPGSPHARQRATLVDVLAFGAPANTPATARAAAAALSPGQFGLFGLLKQLSWAHCLQPEPPHTAAPLLQGSLRCLECLSLPR